MRCIHHLLISNQSLASQLNPQILQKLIHISTRPLPCNTSFNSLIIRQYFNLFMEYLIDTYPGSSRLLPTELQVEEVGETYDEIDLQDCYGVGKEERNEMDEAYGKPHVIRYERRCASPLTSPRSTTSNLTTPTAFWRYDLLVLFTVVLRR